MMTPRESMLLQLHFNASFVTILDGRVAELVKQLAADKTPEMAIEIELLREIYEKFLETKPLIEKLQHRGRIITNANSN